MIFQQNSSLNDLSSKLNASKANLSSRLNDLNSKLNASEANITSKFKGFSVQTNPESTNSGTSITINSPSGISGKLIHTNSPSIPTTSLSGLDLLYDQNEVQTTQKTDVSVDSPQIHQHATDFVLTQDLQWNGQKAPDIPQDLQWSGQKAPDIPQDLQWRGQVLNQDTSTLDSIIDDNEYAGGILQWRGQVLNQDTSTLDSIIDDNKYAGVMVDDTNVDSQQKPSITFTPEKQEFIQRLIELSKNAPVIHLLQ